ncbi:choice-of-anchor D domain-containing protein [Lacinutrix sp. MEBiC02595]
MIKKYALVLIVFLCAFVSGFGQVTTIDFETAGDGYTPSTTNGTGFIDVFNRANPNIGGNNTFFWAAEDLAVNDPYIDIDPINVSGGTSFTFSIDMLANHFQDWDSTDELLITYSLDGGTYQNLMWVQMVPQDTSNGPAALDLGFDGNGDCGATTTLPSLTTGTMHGCTVSNNTFETFSTGTITLSSNSTLDINLQFNNLDAGDEGIYLDNIVIDVAGGTPVPNITATPTTISNLDYVSGAGPSGPQSFDVTGDLLVAGTTITSTSTNFEISLTAVGGYGSSVNIPAGTLNGTTTIYTRLVAGLAVNTYSNNTITIANATPGIGTTPIITVSGEVTPAPISNDICSGAISIIASTDETCNTTTGSTTGATDNNETGDCTTGTENAVWYTFTATATDHDIFVEGIASFDAVISVISNCNTNTVPSGGSCTDATGGGGIEELNLTGLTIGNDYYIQVHDYQGDLTTNGFTICVTTPTPCAAPTVQPSGLTLTNITGSSIDGSFTATTADEYLVVSSTSSTLSGNPVDGTSYNTGDTIGGGTIIQSSNATTFTATGLSQTTQYYFFIFGLNDSSCVAGPTYNTTTPLTGNETTITGPCASESFVSMSNYSSYQTSINWTGDNGIDWTATDSRSDEDLAGDEAIMLRNGSLTNDTSFPGGCGVITFDYARIYSGNSTLQVYINGTQYGGNIAVTGTGSTTFSATINVPGAIDVELRNSGNRTLISNLNWTCYSGGANPELQLVDDTATNQNCGYTIDFGTQGNGTNTDLTFDIENNGSVDLEISSLGIIGDYTIVSPAAPFNVTAGNNQTVTVRFTPTVIGTRTGILTINNNDLDEGACTVNLTGEGFIPVPEIDIERNSGNSIPDGAAANTAYNTIFAATTMGDSSAPKTFHISNEGTADLNVSSLISSNNAEFAITLNPGVSIIAPGTEIDFEITFSPTAVGLRTAVITINNDDANEGSYQFDVQGNGNCAGATLTLSPDNGPVNTIVNVTSSGSNFGVSTTASINGIAATVTIIAANEIEVTIPAGANTGSLEINDNLGCLSSSLFTVIDQLISDCEGSTASTPSDIFISEITDHGSGSHSYVELFNGTGATVDLSDYELRIHGNGNMTATGTIALTGTLPNNEVFVVAFGSTQSTINYASHGYDLANNTSGVNSNDPIRLYKNTTWVDLWGLADYTGDDFTIATKNYTYRRKNSGITAPSTTWNTNDWDSFTPVDYSDIGNYDFSVGVPPIVTTQPTDPNSNCDLTATLNVNATEGFAGGNPLAYQWYYSAPGDTSWTAVTNSAIYTGATGSTLNILNTLTLNDYQYYCEVREDTATCYTASNSVRIKSAATTWDGTDWTNSTPPDINTIAIIDGDYNTLNDGGSFSACQLLVNAGNQLVIANGDYVEVANNVDVYGDGTGLDGILVEDKGSFVQHGDGVNAGTYTLHTNAVTQVNKRTAPLNNYYEYTYWSSPVENETIGNGLQEAHPTRRFWYNGQNYLDRTKETANNNATVSGQDDIDDNGDDWQYTSNTDIMQPAVGYAAMHSQTGFGMPGANYEYTFEGALHTGDYSAPIYRNDLESLDNNWNLIGNPYASAINADAFLAANTVIDDNVSEITSGVTDGAIFFWSQNSPYTDTNNGNQVLNFAQSDYAIINGVGQTSGGDGVTPDRFIPSGQAFFVSMSNTAPATTVSGDIKTADVIFNNSMRVTGNNNQFFRTENSNPHEKIWINLTSDNGVFNQILIGYVPGATNAYDGMYYDAPKNLATDSYSSLYSVIADASGKNKLAIQGKAPESLDLDEIIPLGFTTSITEATIYNFSIAEIQGDFLINNTVYLHDKLMDVLHDLSASDYSFTSETGIFNDRFEIVFNDNRLSTNENELSNALTMIEQPDGTVKFSTSNALQIKNVKVYDVLGRLLYNLSGNSSTETYNLDKLSQAAYLAKVTLSNDVVITKKAIKRN